MVLPSLVVISAIIIIAIFAPLLAPYDPYKLDLAKTLEQPSWEHLLGTDELGRDELSRIIYGTRISLIVGVTVVGFGALVGTVLGLIAGYFGGFVETVIMRFIDALMAFPSIIIAIAVAFALGGGLTNIIIALSIIRVPIFARVAHGQVLSIKETDYVTAARIVGRGNLGIMAYHILHNIAPLVMVLATLNMGLAILSEASLSFLGVGIQPPGAAWGSMLRIGYQYLRRNPLLSIVPGTCIMIMVLSCNLVGDFVRDLIDPKLRGRI